MPKGTVCGVVEHRAPARLFVERRAEAAIFRSPIFLQLLPDGSGGGRVLWRDGGVLGHGVGASGDDTDRPRSAVLGMAQRRERLDVRTPGWNKQPLPCQTA